MVMINQSIVLIALPDIFRGIHLNPLDPSNTSYLLWMLMGFMVVTAVLVVTFGRLGDMFGRVRMYNMGFAVFTLCSILLSVTWLHGSAGALWLIGWRIVQGIGGALLFANSTAILTDAFPVEQRGTALGINSLAAIAGSFLGLVLGGVLAPIDWKMIFLVSVPFGVFGTVWAYLKLRDTGVRQRARMDWWGNVTFAVGLISILVGITYGIQPYGSSTMGWGNPWVLTALIGGAVVLAVFVRIETVVDDPLFRLSLFRLRAFTAGNIASLLTALGRGGLQFMLIIWLQGIWLPLHGYSFERTPLWAGIYMIPLTIGFLFSAPASGWLSDRFGARIFTVVGTLVTAGSFLALMSLPTDFNYWLFALLLLVNGLGSGLFASPNRAEIMNSVPAESRGAGAGMTATFQNSAIGALHRHLLQPDDRGPLPHPAGAMHDGLVQQGVPEGQAQQISHSAAVGVLFAAFLGYNPFQQLLGGHLAGLPDGGTTLTAKGSSSPHLRALPPGLVVAFWFAVVACLIAAVSSLLTERVDRRRRVKAPESLGSELAAVSGEAGLAPSELVVERGHPGDRCGRGPGKRDADGSAATLRRGPGR